MNKPSKGRAMVVAKRNLSWKVTELKLKVIEPQDFRLTPGQFISLRVNNTSFRSYSICSDPSICPEIALAVETGHEGLGSNFVKGLKINDTIEFIGASGNLHLYEPLPQNLYFFATGTGITPFMSMFYQLKHMNYSGKISLFFGVRKEYDAIYIEELENLKSVLPTFNYRVFYSQPEDTTNHKPEHITDIIYEVINANAQYYVAGHPAMVADVEANLLKNGISSTNIIKEGFSRSIQAPKLQVQISTEPKKATV